MRYLLILTTWAIFSLGLVAIFSTTSAEVLDHDLDKSTHQALFKQIGYAFAGLMLAAGVWKIGASRFVEWSPVLLAFFTLALILVLLPGVGRAVNGSKRWLSIGGFSFQPSEFVKYLVPAFFIHRLLLIKEEITFKEFLKLIGLVAVPMLLIMVEPNNGTCAVIGITIASLCFLTRIPFKFWAWPLVGFIFVGGIFAINLPYVSARLKVYMHPELDLKGKGHQPYQAKIAAGSGGFLGKGPGNSLQKLSYLPEAQNDYIAAIFAEEFGFLGILTLVNFYALLTYFGFSLTLRAINPQEFYLGAAITFLFSFQAFMNLGVVSGLLPSTGLNLPLFSQGGSSLMANFLGLALLLSIKTESEVKDGYSV